MKKSILLGFVIGLVGASLVWLLTAPDVGQAPSQANGQVASIEKLVNNMAKAWETGNVELLKSVMHEDIVFAYPGRRLNFQETVEDMEYYREAFVDTNVYINEIIIDGENLAVEWQFATTNKETGKRGVTSDGIIGKVKDGKILVWKEYLDGRVSRMQAVDALPLEEGEEPFPAPVGSLRNFCEVVNSTI